MRPARLWVKSDRWLGFPAQAVLAYLVERVGSCKFRPTGLSSPKGKNVNSRRWPKDTSGKRTISETTPKGLNLRRPAQ